MRRFRLRGLSIQERLPLLICILLLTIILSFAWISYYAVRSANHKAGSERLVSLTEVLSSLFAQSAQQMITTSNASVNTDPIRKFIRSKGTESYADASNALQTNRKDTTTVLAEFIYPDRTSILRSAKELKEDKESFDSLVRHSPLSPGISRFYLAGKNIYYSITIPIGDKDSVIGYFVRWRIQSASARAIKQFTDLIGNGSHLFVGNIDGSIWSNLQGPIAHSELDTSLFHEPRIYSNQQGEPVMGSTRPIGFTPWQITIEFDATIIMSPAKTFLRWITIVGSILLIIGIFFAWIMSLNLTKPLNNLTSAASSIANGTYMKVTEVDRKDEVGKLARAFNAMSEQVNNAKKILENKIVETEQINNQLRDLSAHLQNIREEERIHIAREMHDELGQLLTGFKMDVSWLNKKLTANDDPLIQEKLSEMVMIIDEAVKFVRRIAAELRPGILDDLGLIPALDWHSKEFEKRFKIPVEFSYDQEELKTTPGIATGLFRMYQESLTNVARHSEAKRVTSRIEIRSNEIQLSIKDDGKGFNTSQESKTLGLLGMRERAAMIGGHLEIKSTPGRGTHVLIRVPV
jgi:signal transduction histidine kinase